MHRIGGDGGRIDDRRRVLVLLGAALGIPARRDAADVADHVRRTIALPAAAVVEIDASMASVRITGTSRQDIDLEVERSAPSRDDLARFPVVVESDGARVRITVVQSGTDARLKATIRIEVPRRAHIASLRVAEGRLDVVDLAGVLAAEVRRGPIAAARVSGTVRLETGIGDIDVRDAHLAADGLIRLRTFNGDVHLAFAEPPSDARVMALALNGTVTSQLPLTLKTGWGPRWGEATIGRGAPVVSLDVVSGDITIAVPKRP